MKMSLYRIGNDMHRLIKKKIYLSLSDMRYAPLPSSMLSIGPVDMLCNSA